MKVGDNINTNNLIYALKDGQLIHISKVESGLNCECYCPSCGERLVAKKGNKVVHHFAHKANSECVAGYQTSLHLLAKEILAESKTLLIPKVSIDFSKYGDTYKETIISEPKMIDIDKVELEQKQGEIIPDIIVYCGGKKIYVEIYVTHRIDDCKLEKIKNCGISTIEIDLSQTDRFISKDMLKEALIEKTDNKTWVFNSVEKIWYDRFINQSEILKISGNRAKNCPIRKRKDQYGNIYALHFNDCYDCKYCIDVMHNIEYQVVGVRCTGKSRISEISDFSIPSAERIQKTDKLLEEEMMDSIANDRCPYCNEKLVDRKSKYGFFKGCSNYPYCRFKVSINDKTGELIY